MSYGPNQMYPGATELDPNYPKDKFKDNNPSTTNNGTPLKAIKENQGLTLETAVMNDAGFEYNGLPDTPDDSQLFKAYKASLGNGANLLSNHNFLIQTPDDSQPLPSATPTSYPPGYQIFSGVFANETTGITNLTYIDGRVSFSGGDLYFSVPNTGAIEQLTAAQLTASVADFDGKPRDRGVSFALVGGEYRLTVTTDALEDASAALTPLGSVKFEKGVSATSHEVIRSVSDTPYDFDRSFSSAQQMLAESHEGISVKLPVGTKVKTGATTWLITNSTKGWELDAADGRYALPLNGVFISDLGADTNGGNDASDAFDLAISRYDINNKKKFALVLAGAKLKVSRQIKIEQDCSGFNLSGGGAEITATANMDSVLTWPRISDFKASDIRFFLDSGVVITDAVVDGSRKDGDSGKSIRTKLDNLQGFNIAGAPIFLRMTQEWEFKYKNIRSDHDVSGQTGTNIQLRSCVNGQFKAPEVGYSAVGIQFAPSPDVAYKCEGIDLIAPITTYAAIALKGDNVTALKVSGGVLDFCLTRAWEFTNGADVAFNGTWFANRSDSVATGTMGTSQPAFSAIKLTGTHFVNNASGVWDAVSLNSDKCKLLGNTSDGDFNAGFLKDTADYYGNDFLPDTNVNAVSSTQIAQAGANSAVIKKMRSGVDSFSVNKLLSRLEFTAPNINASTNASIDVKSGSFSDQSIIDIVDRGVPIYRLNMPEGNIELLKSGSGIVFTSPDGLTTKTLTIDNTGNPVWS